MTSQITYILYVLYLLHVHLFYYMDQIITFVILYTNLLGNNYYHLNLLFQ